jgi:hypothetical protein
MKEEGRDRKKPGTDSHIKAGNKVQQGGVVKGTNFNRFVVVNSSPALHGSLELNSNF